MELTESDKSALLDRFPRYNLVVDEHAQITFAESGCEQLLDCDADQLVGMELSSFIHRDDYERVEQLLADNDSESLEKIEFRAETITGEWRIFETLIGELPNTESGGTVLSVKDITERRQEYLELQEKTERLEQFAKMVSHDIRTPLQVAKGHLTQAESTGDEHSFEKVKQSHDRIEEIVSDVLDLARQGSDAGELESISLEAVARKAWELTETAEMELEIRDDRQMEAEPQRLQQLFENMFTNVLRHAGPESKVVVGPLDPMATATRTKAELPTGFFVADDGPGIPGDEKEKVLEAGFSTNADGTGFGLAIVEQIAEVYHWRIEIKDSYIGGARFEFIELSETELLDPTN